ncbi:MAG: SAM-dependent chlorinase/fluorinase [Anaerolineales bacterium]|nr:SAM-dependent chlorinase/fluorinase [Anaerolineales bacterium]MDW8227284.1 SAM-dependent chlorinase/fluorinase [Anaerolineales bacterium]
MKFDLSWYIYDMPIITLTTDFGLKDSFVGTMKGVILSICPTAQLVDLTHEIPPQNILAGGLALWRAFPYFPAGTVHIAVVDPGVGTSRRPLAVRLGGQYLVGPDNGLFTSLYEEAEGRGWSIEIVHLTNKSYFLPEISRTFHGRDIFSPVAAHLANGVPLTEFGPPVPDPVRLSLPKPERLPYGWRAQVIGVDHFGNLTTNLPAAVLFAPKQTIVRLGRFEIRGVSATYGEHAPGELIALIDSENRLEIALVNGNAAQFTGAHIGDEVEVFDSPEG